jgi:hypothetical protein
MDRPGNDLARSNGGAMTSPAGDDPTRAPVDAAHLAHVAGRRVPVRDLIREVIGM